MQKFTWRIRRCDGNKRAWLLVRLRDDGTESESYGSYATAMNLNALMARLAGNGPAPGEVIEFIYAP